MLRKLNRDDRGVALIMVVVALVAILGLVTAAISYAVGSQPLSRRDQDWNAALAAAEAGVDDYLFYLNSESNYWQYNAMNPPPGGNAAFTGWVTVPGPANEGQFRYDVDASNVTVDGTVGLVSTGKVRNVTRSVEVTLRRRSFLDYLYFTEYETKDPALYVRPPDPFTPAQAQVQCAKHWYAGRNANCIDINFFTRDQINGPLHTNDAFLVSGSPRFLGDTTTSLPNLINGRRYRCNGPCTPVFARAGDPRYAEPLTMPPSNASIKVHTDPLVGGTGCLYTGPTRITLNSNGTMNVTSPFTRTSNCATGAGLALPPNGVIYVQNVPANPADPNYTAGCPYNVNGRNHPLGMPVPNDITTYACRDGDVLLSGTLRGQLTIAAEHNIVITSHTRYQTGVTGTDLLGLVANNYVEVYHPVRCTTNGNPACNIAPLFTNPVIQAANLSVQHSFRVQNYSAGDDLGQLNVTGVIAQQYRGIVGTFSGNNAVSGYEKNYVYDTRLRYMSPPHFLDPVKSAWGVRIWSERTAAYQP